MVSLLFTSFFVCSFYFHLSGARSLMATFLRANLFSASVRSAAAINHSPNDKSLICIINGAAFGGKIN